MCAVTHNPIQKLLNGPLCAKCEGTVDQSDLFMLGLKTQLKDMVNNIRGSKTLTDHLISNDRVDEVVIGTEDDVSIFHQPSTSKVGARLQGLC